MSPTEKHYFTQKNTAKFQTSRSSETSVRKAWQKGTEEEEEEEEEEVEEEVEVEVEEKEKEKVEKKTDMDKGVESNREMQMRKK